jgi:hypothetical protein
LYTLYEKITACVTRGPCPENSWRSFDIIFIIYHSDMLIMMIKVIHSHLEPCWKSSLQLWKFFNFGLIFFRRSRQTEHACFGFFFLWDERKILIYYNLYINFNTHLTTLKDIYKYLIFKWTPIFKNILVKLFFLFLAWATRKGFFGHREEFSLPFFWSCRVSEIWQQAREKKMVSRVLLMLFQNRQLAFTEK